MPGIQYAVATAHETSPHHGTGDLHMQSIKNALIDLWWGWMT